MKKLKKRAEMGMGLLIDNRDEPLVSRVKDIIRDTIEACVEAAQNQAIAEIGEKAFNDPLSRRGELARRVVANVRELLK